MDSTETGDAVLIALERELGDCLAEYDQLRQAWPKGKHVMERYETGKKVEAALARIRDLEAAIVRSSPRSLAGAAVLLRRVEAQLEEGPTLSLLTSAIEVVEAAATR